LTKPSEHLDTKTRPEQALVTRGQGADAVHTIWFERPEHKGLELWAYSDKLSYAQGDEVVLYVHTTASSFDVRIYRDGAHPRTLFTRNEITGQCQDTPASAYRDGCDWEPSLSFTLSEEWASGGYVVELTCIDGPHKRVSHHWFAVRPAPGPREGRILLVCTTSTWSAYNDWGGANHYEGEDGDAPGHSPVLSTQRPWARGQIWKPAGAPRLPTPKPVPMGWAPRYPWIEWAYANGYSKYCALSGWASYDGPFVAWAESQGFCVDVITQTDLHRDADILQGYPVVSIVGHDEYWSADMRDHLDAWVDAGGQVARFAGNFLWQIRLEESETKQICYKLVDGPVKRDPLVGTKHEHLLTTAWDSPRVGRPGALTMGVTGTSGCYAGFGAFSPRSSGGFTVYDNRHWVFTDTDLYIGDVFGSEAHIAHFEVDGLDINFRRGRPYTSGLNGVSEEQVDILALCHCGFREEDHSNPGTSLLASDEDRESMALILYGDDAENHMEELLSGFGTITCYRRGKGEVLCAGASQWVNGLIEHDPFVEKITCNVLNHYLEV